MSLIAAELPQLLSSSCLLLVEVEALSDESPGVPTRFKDSLHPLHNHSIYLQLPLVSFDKASASWLTNGLNTLIESRDANDQALKKPPKTFLWTNWANITFCYQFTMINWPAHLLPCSSGPGFKNTHGISSKDITGMVHLWRNYKDNELNDEEADSLLCIVEWSPEEKDMDLKDQATIALAVDDSKQESLVTVHDSLDYLKAMGKRSVAQAKEMAGAECQSQKAVGADGRLLNASKIDFTEEGNDDEMFECPAKHARYHVSTQNPEAHYFPAKPACKRTCNEDEDFGTISEGERGLNQNIKKLPHRTHHPLQPVSRDSSRHNTRPPLLNSGKVIHPHNRQSDIYHGDNHDYPVCNQAGSSRQLYTINDDEFGDDY
ncbi:hypothetical protein BDN71DRAFT_1436031 [Pleurotus eryngii]|uniref:Uncharacterized protein n=1 Tax=Pleurotus eryngii TaxID=5323 RepID=A0A9P6D1B1_PLEER|nr:hypothetical protein BDN71DRAFT_1436031 [Pleurotus eryngii]